MGALRARCEVKKCRLVERVRLTIDLSNLDATAPSRGSPADSPRISSIVFVISWCLCVFVVATLRWIRVIRSNPRSSASKTAMSLCATPLCLGASVVQPRWCDGATQLGWIRVIRSNPRSSVSNSCDECDALRRTFGRRRWCYWPASMVAARSSAVMPPPSRQSGLPAACTPKMCSTDVQTSSESMLRS